MTYCVKALLRKLTLIINYAHDTITPRVMQPQSTAPKPVMDVSAPPLPVSPAQPADGSMTPEVSNAPLPVHEAPKLNEAEFPPPAQETSATTPSSAAPTTPGSTTSTADAASALPAQAKPQASKQPPGSGTGGVVATTLGVMVGLAALTILIYLKSQ
jgi:hypothetical protein